MYEWGVFVISVVVPGVALMLVAAWIFLPMYWGWRQARDARMAREERERALAAWRASKGLTDPQDPQAGLQGAMQRAVDNLGNAVAAVERVTYLDGKAVASPEPEKTSADLVVHDEGSPQAKGTGEARSPVPFRSAVIADRHPMPRRTVEDLIREDKARYAKLTTECAQIEAGIKEAAQASGEDGDMAVEANRKAKFDPDNPKHWKPDYFLDAIAGIPPKQG